ERARAQYHAPRRRRHPPARSAERRSQTRVEARLRGPGAGHPGRRSGTEGRLHDRFRSRPRPRWSAATHDRFPDRVTAGRGHPGDGRAMEVIEQLPIPVADATGPGEARRVGLDLARSLGFGDTDVGRVGIVVTEAATNLVKHGGGGEILLRVLRNARSAGISLPAPD